MAIESSAKAGLSRTANRDVHQMENSYCFHRLTSDVKELNLELKGASMIFLNHRASYLKCHKFNKDAIIVLSVNPTARFG